METVQIARTRNQDFHLLGSGGQLAIRAHDQLSHYLRRVLSPVHAALLAEPNFDPDRGSIDWYAPAGGPVRRLVDLPMSERAAAEAHVQALTAEVRAESARLREAPRESDRLIGEMLALALEVPGLEWVHLVGDQPVLVAWGHRSAVAGAMQGILGRTIQAPRIPPLVAPPPPLVLGRPSAPVWPLLAAALLLIGAAWLSWPWFVGQLGLTMPACRIPEDQLAAVHDLRIEAEREQELRRALAEAVESVGKARLACPPVVVEPPPPPKPPEPPPEPPKPPPEPPKPPPPAPEPPKPPPAPPPEDDDQKRVQDRGGTTGEVQVTLAWDDRNDLDLFIQCPTGQSISYRTRTECGGNLDLDANVRRPFRRDPVENAVWVEAPPAGRYVVMVEFSEDPRDRPLSSFRVMVRIAGKPERRVEGSVGVGEKKRVLDFTID